MDLPHTPNKLIVLLLSALVWIEGCAHQSASQIDTPDGAVPYSEDIPYPDGVTAAIPAFEMPLDLTESTEAVTISTEPPPQSLERPSPPSLGVESLTELADPRFPSRGASLSLAQEGRMAWLNHDPVDARQKLQSSLQVWGNNPYAHYYLGMLELEAGHYALATRFAKNAIRNLRANPFWNARAYLLLSQTLERSGDERGAFEASEKAFELDPRVELR